MPPASSIQTFINALKTGQTRTTLALDELFAAPGALAASLTLDQTDSLKVPGAFDKLVDWVRTLLLGVTNPLTVQELDHIDQWPNQYKEQLRQRFLRSFQDNRSVRFYWKLYDGIASDTIIVDLGPIGTVVTFRSPRSQVTLSEADASVSIEIV